MFQILPVEQIFWNPWWYYKNTMPCHYKYNAMPHVSHIYAFRELKQL